MEVSHTDFSEVTARHMSVLHRVVEDWEAWVDRCALHNRLLPNEDVPRMVSIHVRSVVMLTTGKTTTTGMLAVLAYTTVTGGHMAAAAEIE
jgi:hypothetical protein